MFAIYLIDLISKEINSIFLFFILKLKAWTFLESSHGFNMDFDKEDERAPLLGKFESIIILILIHYQGNLIIGL